MSDETANEFAKQFFTAGQKWFIGAVFSALTFGAVTGMSLLVSTFNMVRENNTVILGVVTSVEAQDVLAGKMDKRLNVVEQNQIYLHCEIKKMNGKTCTLEFKPVEP